MTYPDKLEEIRKLENKELDIFFESIYDFKKIYQKIVLFTNTQIINKALQGNFEFNWNNCMQLNYKVQ